MRALTRTSALPQRCANPRWLASACNSASVTCSSSSDSPRAKRVYLIAGEASGDAIGAKVIRALERKRIGGDPRARTIEFRGIGGPLMCTAGRFDSLFPMHELSVMGLVEVLPFLWRFRQRLNDTLADIRAFAPDVVLTIDSKGFTFRVLRALHADATTRDAITRMHYVAPSVWAYKHRRTLLSTDDHALAQLLDRMFTLLPFERRLFVGDDARSSNSSSSSQDKDKDKGDAWCCFVGHPAVEDFLEFHRQFDRVDSAAVDTKALSSTASLPLYPLQLGVDALLDACAFAPQQLAAQGALFQSLMATTQRANQTNARHALGLPANALVLCALVGSRANEVEQVVQVVLDGIQRFCRQAQSSNRSNTPREVVIVLPTIGALATRVQHALTQHASSTAADASTPLSFETRVLSDLSASERFQLFQMADAAVAVSGTIVMETTLAALPTVVVYRANRVTEWLATRLAAVRYVSIPNLLLGRPMIPELLFRDCTPANIDAALRKICVDRASPTSPLPSMELAVALSTLTQWRHDVDSSGAHLSPQPLRASDTVAHAVLDALDAK